MFKSLPEFHRALLKLCAASAESVDCPGELAPCAQLVQDMEVDGSTRFVELHTQSPGTNECRLNGQGLKLCYEVDYYRVADETTVFVSKFRIDGEQVEQYPAFVRTAESILNATTATDANLT